MLAKFKRTFIFEGVRYRKNQDGVEIPDRAFDVLPGGSSYWEDGKWVEVERAPAEKEVNVLRVENATINLGTETPSVHKEPVSNVTRTPADMATAPEKSAPKGKPKVDADLKL